jgi:hypothetical protein
MSRHHLNVPANDNVRILFKRMYDIVVGNTMEMAWGLDNDGYFISLWVEYEGDDFYLEDGLMGGSKNRVIEKMEKYDILDFVRKAEPDKFNNLVLDLPF